MKNNGIGSIQIPTIDHPIMCAYVGYLLNSISNYVLNLFNNYKYRNL